MNAEIFSLDIILQHRYESSRSPMNGVRSYCQKFMGICSFIWCCVMCDVIKANNYFIEFGQMHIVGKLIDFKPAKILFQI